MTLGLKTHSLAKGTEILLTSQCGILVGSSIVESDFTAITLYGDDATSDEPDGLADG